MAGLRRLVEAMRQEARALEGELFAAREERAASDMERATAADEADAAAAALAAAAVRQTELVAAVDEACARAGGNANSARASDRVRAWRVRLRCDGRRPSWSLT